MDLLHIVNFCNLAINPYHPQRGSPEHNAVRLLQSMKTIITVLALGLLVLSVAFYRSCRPEGALDVDPHARKEIEKARQK
jgi:hypothetical protein